MNTDESISHYEWVLRDADERKTALQSQIADLQREARDLTVTIGGILRLAPAALVARYSSGLMQPSPIRNGRGGAYSQIPNSQKFSTLSTRWALLLALSESSQPISIPDLAEQLKAGGFSSDASNFNNNVSSVLSRMKGAKGEVDMIDSRWFITEVGRSAITYIKAQKLRRRLSRKTETPDDAGTPSGELKGEL